MSSTLVSASPESLVVRAASESDLAALEEMIRDFAKGHPAELHQRSPERLREAHFGPSPVARLVVATRDGRVIGMAQWTKIYEMFWGMYGASVEWLYVRPQFRGSGIVAAIVAEVCAQVRRAGGEFLYGGGGDDVEPLYERVAIGSPTNQCHLSAQAFQAFADLAGLPPRSIVRSMPSVEQNRVTASARAQSPNTSLERTRES
jgi:GNAT superfamily N-acetyltransferase